MRSQDPSAATPEQGFSRNGVRAEGPSSPGSSSGDDGVGRSAKERSRKRGVPTARAVREDYGEVFTFCQFPSDRRLPILQDMRAAGVRRALDPDILRGIDEALRFEERLHEHEAAWAGQTERAFAEGARDAAWRLERSLSSLFRILASIGESLPEGQAKKQVADRLRKALFPNGVAALANQAYKVKHAAVGELLKRASRKECARDLELLGLRPQGEHLADLHRAFGEALRLSGPLEFAALQRLRREGQQALSVIIARVLGVHYGSDAESRRLRDEVLRPVLFHDEQLRRIYRRRRATNSAETLGEVGGPSAR